MLRPGQIDINCQPAHMIAETSRVLPQSCAHCSLLQSWQANQVAESVITFAVKSFEIEQPYQKLDEYLRLTEAMLAGILQYEVSTELP